MDFETWVSTDHTRVRGAIVEALDWCEQFHVAAEGPDSAEGESPFWKLVLERTSYLGGVLVSRASEAEAWLLNTLSERQRLHVLEEANAGSGNVLWCSHGFESRVFLVAGRLDKRALTNDGAPWVYFGGPTGDLPDGLTELIKRLRASGRTPNAAEVDDLVHGEAQVPVYQRQIRSVRDAVVGDALRGRSSFFELDEEAQGIALWSALFGEGTLDIEQAIRLSAQRLRAQGWLEYGALRQAGEIYQTIEQRLTSERRAGELFDRPRRAHIRAIELEVDRFTADDWRDCLMGALATQHRVDREHAIRLAFGQAQQVYGLGVQRLRGGGRAERAIKSAINSAIRQGYLERDGAMYVIRVAELGDPIQRGARTESEPEAEQSTPPAAPPDSERPTPTEPTQQTAVPESEPPAPAPPQQPETPEPPPLRERQLYELEFPTRTLNWAERQGVHTIGELLAWDPEDFANQRNVGRRTVRQTRAALEEAFGCSWEQARAGEGATSRPAPVPEVDEEAITAGGSRGWAVFSSTLVDEHRAIPLSEVELPARMKNFVDEERIRTVGDLLSRNYDDLRAQKNLGRKSLNDTLDAIQEAIHEREHPVIHETFLDAWRVQLASLKPLHRMIVSRRAGMHGTRETLEELGAILGVTRERVRQIEARVVERLQSKSRWRRTLTQHLEAAFGAGRALPLNVLAEEPWWAGIDQQQRLLDFVLSRILESDANLISAPSGRVYLARFSEDRFAQAESDALERISKLEFPTEYDSVLAILEDECSRLDATLLEELEMVAREQLHFSPTDPALVTGYGADRASEVVAFLNAQREPVPVADVEEKLGRGNFPEEVLYFKRGLIGLKKHFPDFEAWMEKLVPVSIEVMNARPVGRQWLVPEIHEELQSRKLLPEWMGHWHLASLLRLSGKVSYLGRLRVALEGSGQQERLHFEDVFVELLEDTGTPLPFDDLVSRARATTDVRDETAKLMVLQAPFVRLDETRVGLVDRDIPGAPDSVASAVEAVTEQLTRTGRGVTPHQATGIVQGVSELHETWTRQLVVSILRSEPSLRLDRSQNIGLAEWDDARCPSRSEFIRKEVLKSGGMIPIDLLTERMAAFFGKAPDTGTLTQMAGEVGLARFGDNISKPGGVVTEKSPTPSALNMAGIPTELREMFEDLSREPLSDPATLRTQVDAHLGEFLKEHQVNEFVDLDGAHRLTRQSHLLLDRWEQLSTAERHLVHAAVRYFVITEDVEEDFDIGGLDDDKQIMDAVFEHLGIDDEAHARAS